MIPVFPPVSSTHPTITIPASPTASPARPNDYLTSAVYLRPLMCMSHA